MKNIFYSLLIFIASYAHSQSQSSSSSPPSSPPSNNNYQQEINEQVWKPFIQSFNAQDDEGFSKVHSKEVARVLQDDGRIIGFAEYFKQVPDSIKAKWGAWKRSIELRFIQRIANSEKAFEVGYYKTTNTNTATGETSSRYGKFHVLHRKENGQWKILMDADANEKTTEAIFQSAKSME